MRAKLFALDPASTTRSRRSRGAAICVALLGVALSFWVLTPTALADQICPPAPLPCADDPIEEIDQVEAPVEDPTGTIEDTVGGAVDEVTQTLDEVTGGTDPGPGGGSPGSGSSGSIEGGSGGGGSKGAGGGARGGSASTGAVTSGVGIGNADATSSIGRRPGDGATGGIPTLGELATDTAKGLALMGFLALVVLGFVTIQDRLDRNDPKLRLAPLERDVLSFA